jgi:hypothetical protein
LQIYACCGRYPDVSTSESNPNTCESLYEIPNPGGDEYDLAYGACDVYCSALTSAPEWCSGGGGGGGPTEDQKFVACYGGNPSGDIDYKKFGECCGAQPTYPYCQSLSVLCEPFYKNGTVPSGVSEENGKKVCDAYCSALEETADWCSSGLSAGAVAGIAIGGVAVVGAVAGLLVYFLIIKKPGSDAEP